MDILIDTHIFLWLADDNFKIKPRYFKELKNLNNNIYLSSLSIAEIMIKKSLGKIDFEDDILAVLAEMSIKVLDFDAKSAVHLAALPFHHKDPFDRMIIAQSITNKFIIFTVDKKFKMYECELLKI
jgi:PIN domain nuclease of toxin-antitoxin system